METRNVIDDNMSTGKLYVTEEIKNFLKETAKWSNFLAIVGFVFIGIIVILGIMFATVMGSFMDDLPAGGPAGLVGGTFLSLIYIIMGLIYFFPTLYLYRFAAKMKTALANDDQAFLHQSFLNLKSCFKYMGILMAIVLGFYALIFVFALIGGGMAAFM